MNENGNKIIEMNQIIKISKSIVYIKRILLVMLLYLMHTLLYDFVGTHHVNNNFNLLTELDNVFPFVPGMVYIYMSFYIVIIVSVLFIKTEEQFNRIYASIIGTLLFTYPIFYFFPAYYPVPAFETNTFTTKFLKWCFEADVPNNTFPSLHVSLSFTVAFAIKHYRKKLGIVYMIWAIGITLSTIMIRKHFLIDTFSGIVVAAFSYDLFISGKFTKPLFDGINKTKYYLANLFETKLMMKGLRSEFVYILITVLKMK